VIKTRPRIVALVAGVLVALVTLTGCGSSPKNVSLYGTVVDPPYTPSGTALTTTDGGTFSLAKDTTAPLTLIFFGYTHCPDICPAVMSSIASGLAKLSRTQQKQVKLYFISTDPKRDTPKVLADYVSRFNPTFHGLGGDLKAVSAVAKALHVFVDDGTQLASGGYDPNSHGTYVFGINAKHQAPIFWNGETAPSEFASDFRFLLTKKPDHLEAGP
jgi:protein SCO1/2